MATHLTEKCLIGCPQQLGVVVVCRQIVGAEVDAYHLWLVTAEVPTFATIVEVGILVLRGHHVVGCSGLRTAIAAVDTDA